MWKASLGCFVIAATTGFLYRLGIVGWMPSNLSLENIRHAHSHLMFFGWAVPFPMYFIIQKVDAELKANEPNILMTRMAMASIFMGVASYPFFLLYGYRPVPVAGMDLPLSVIFSGLVMLCWYGFMAGYWKERKYISDDLPIRFYDGALLMLFICSLGAWGVAVVQFSGVANPLFGKALTHFFLATFTEGWVVLILLGLLYESMEINTDKLPVAPTLLTGLILLGAPLTFPYGISEGLMSNQLLFAARAGGLLAAAGLGLNFYLLYRGTVAQTAWYWKLILILLGIKALAQFAASVLPAHFWISEHSLRLLYLHLLLLGAFSLSILAWWHMSTNIPVRFFNGIVLSVVIVLVSLLSLTSLWPAMWSGPWIFYLLAVAALLPVLAIGAYWFKMIQSQNNIR
ncbi:hypothetical protein [Fodinibius salsisoli]|uniref:Uncharacterized protein n=1 Tax=Fodinibius salsisoli TaxID=2820877 RepID=A0ABT3PN26_9BACT|nr:hypothetical protein [Fodinibius salsisoli]MCW9707309.1 hypothetical protein [Fodinibius salsisoli]